MDTTCGVLCDEALVHSPGLECMTPNDGMLDLNWMTRGTDKVGAACAVAEAMS
jgi:hypothetical protein